LQKHLSRGQEWRRVLRPRVIVYTTILVLVSAAVLASLILRTPFKVDVVRDRASLARIVDEGRIENVYRLQIMNASEQAQRFHVAVGGLEGAKIIGEADVEVGPAAARWMPVAVQVPPASAKAAGGGAHRIDFEITQLAANDAASRHISERSTFVVPR